MDNQLIKLDCSTRSSLDWREALAALGEGRVTWELDTALFEDSLEDEARYLALELAFRHFAKEVWPHYAERSEAIILFRGPLSLADRDSVVNYLVSLGAALPEEATLQIVLDTDGMGDAMTFFKLISPDRYAHLELILEGVWAKRYPYILQKGLPLALCPPQEGDWSDVLEKLGDRPFRLIPEALLTHEWDGVEELIVFSDAVSPKLRRKLLGFCAAEGVVRTIGEPLGLPLEMPLETVEMA